MIHQKWEFPQVRPLIFEHQLARLRCTARDVIALHRRYLEEGEDLTWLESELTPLRQRIQQLLEQGARGRHEKTANFCSALLAEHDALSFHSNWTPRRQLLHRAGRQKHGLARSCRRQGRQPRGPDDDVARTRVGDLALARKR